MARTIRRGILGSNKKPDKKKPPTKPNSQMKSPRHTQPRKNKDSGSNSNSSPLEVSADSNEVQSSSSAQNEESFYTIEWEKLIGEASIWPFLSIHGPYHHMVSHLGKNVTKNRKFCKFLRSLSSKIHKKAVEIKEEDVPRMKKDFVLIENVPDIVEKMCQKVFRYEMDSLSNVELYERGTMTCLQRLFAEETLRIEFDAFSDISQRLSDIFNGLQFSVTPEQLRQVRNAIICYWFDLSLDLIRFIFEIKANEMFIGVIDTSVFEEVSTSSMERNNHQSSFWNSSSIGTWNLTDIVFGQDHVKTFDERAEVFLYDRLFAIQFKMKRMIDVGYMRAAIEYYLDGKASDEMSLDDPRVQSFLEKIGSKVLNVDDFRMFNNGWKEFALRTIGHMRNGSFVDGIGKCIRESTDPSLLKCITSLLADNPSMVSHVLVNLLRFVMCFLLNTIRHVFHFNPNTFTVHYDGKFEGDEEMKLKMLARLENRRNRRKLIGRRVYIDSESEIDENSHDADNQEEDLVLQTAPQTVLIPSVQQIQSQSVKNEEREEVDRVTENDPGITVQFNGLDLQDIDHQRIHEDFEHEVNEQSHNAGSSEEVLENVRQNVSVQSIIEAPEENVKNEEPEDENQVMTNAPMLSDRIQSNQNTPRDHQPARDLSTIPSTSSHASMAQRRRHLAALENKEEENEPRNWKEAYRSLKQEHDELKREHGELKHEHGELKSRVEFLEAAFRRQ